MWLIACMPRSSKATFCKPDTRGGPRSTGGPCPGASGGGGRAGSHQPDAPSHPSLRPAAETQHGEHGREVTPQVVVEVEPPGLQALVVGHAVDAVAVRNGPSGRIPGARESASAVMGISFDRITSLTGLRRSRCPQGRKTVDNRPTAECEDTITFRYERSRSPTTPLLHRARGDSALRSCGRAAPHLPAGAQCGDQTTREAVGGGAVRAGRRAPPSRMRAKP